MLDTSNWPDPNSTSERVGKWLALIYLCVGALAVLYFFYWIIRGEIRLWRREKAAADLGRRGFAIVQREGDGGG